MRTSALAAAAAALLAGGCGELPAGPAAAPPDAAAAVSPATAHPGRLPVADERIAELSASLADARGRVLPSLENRDAPDQALAALDAALNGGTAAQVQASARQALAVLDDAAQGHPEAGPELDAIRLAVSEVLAAAEAPPTEP
ncbi:MAG TPA: hypothetical protein VFJ82_16385 [Longimicrobium sp.]|nr:hypothetical protein [Longimicrobium sp.]